MVPITGFDLVPRTTPYATSCRLSFTGPSVPCGTLRSAVIEVNDEERGLFENDDPSAAYCKCPVEQIHRSCNSVDSKLATAPIVPTPSSFSSEYVDAHSIRLQIPPHPAAFAYIFEYATVSTKPDEWYFAGATTMPIVTFTILDPCRDYKFRTIVVMRSSNPLDHFVIYSDRSIPVQLPPFVLSPDQISAEAPIFNATTESLRIYVRWTLPRGYSDSDIYGYEAPALYPLQCRTPEDELPQPKIEIVRAGGRLAVSLPSYVLEARCRLWVEVRMLPRCVRLEPFSIQKNIEIDCDRNPELDICTKEANPICMEVQEVSGKRGRALLKWTPPPREPLYYHVRYGPAQMKGAPPFVTWQLATKRDIKVESKVTNIALDVAEDQDFGVQVCAILTPHRKRPKFGLIRVTPFHCTSCKNMPLHSVGRCGECGKVEGTTVEERGWKDLVKARDPVQPHKIKSAAAQTVFRMETDLVVGGAALARHSGSNISVAQVHTHAAESPIAIERAEEINGLATTSTELPPLISEVTETTTPIVTPLTELATVVTTVAEEEETTTTKEETQTEMETTTPGQEIETTKTSEITSETATETPAEATAVVDVSAEMRHFEASNATFNGPSVDDMAPKVDEKNVDKESVEKSDIKREQLSRELEESVKHLEQALEEAEKTREEHRTDSDLEDPANGNETISEEAVKKAATELVRKLESSSTELRHHEKSKKCLLSSGIVCNFGCESPKTCRCPSLTHVLSPTGGCVSRDSFGNVFCLPSTEVNATWDPAKMNVMIRSEEIFEHIRSTTDADELLVEFGRLDGDSAIANTPWGGLRLDESERSRMVVAIEKIFRTGAFLNEPFVFHANESVNIIDDVYGVRFCLFNGAQIKDPYNRDWDIDIVANKTGTTLQVLIMIVLVYLNCSRIRLLYDRKRTHYYRPYYIDPQVQVTSLHPYSAHLTSQKRAGFYPSRFRAI
ncbi:hypothetical protein Q1695_002734 [Nippostrongylus brasiliensis]|nr:hypothetical protein Q1695_002734 [Nippostrongylus brasiliensis]